MKGSLICGPFISKILLNFFKFTIEFDGIIINNNNQIEKIVFPNNKKFKL